ncbi:uncharacterized protein [Diadema antillarum]|uniref:uncharacterized protein n=1 Tax=Diadema antillarum TaxID=105358 RepID=UPI003A877B09
MQQQALPVVIVVIFIATLAQLELDTEPLVARRSVTLQRPKDEAFQMITNIHKFEKWMTTVVHVAEDDGSLAKVGKSFRLYTRTPLKTLEVPAAITKYQPISSFEFETQSLLFSTRFVFDIEHGDRDGFSRLTWKIYARRRSYLYLVTVVQPLKFILSNHVTASLLSLKILLN